MAEVTETLLSQKLERSSWRANDVTDNFKEEKELTVEITLAEYRELIARNAKSSYEMEKKDDEIRDLKHTIGELTRKVNHLESVLSEIKCYKPEGKENTDAEE